MARPKKLVDDIRLPLRIERATVEALDEAAEARGVNRSALIREILQRYIRRWKIKNNADRPG